MGQDAKQISQDLYDLALSAVMAEVDWNQFLPMDFHEKDYFQIYVFPK